MQEVPVGGWPNGRVTLCLNTTLWKRIGGMDEKLHSVWTPTLGGDEWSASRSGRFISRREPFVPVT